MWESISCLHTLIIHIGWGRNTRAMFTPKQASFTNHKNNYSAYQENPFLPVFASGSPQLLSYLFLVLTLFFLFLSRHRTSSRPQPLALVFSDGNHSTSLAHEWFPSYMLSAGLQIPIYKQLMGSGYFYRSFQIYFSHKPSWFFLYWTNFSKELNLKINLPFPLRSWYISIHLLLSTTTIMFPAFLDCSLWSMSAPPKHFKHLYFT